MSVEKWTAHFERMQNGSIYPQQNGIWRLQSNQEEKSKKRIPVRRTVPVKRKRTTPKTSNSVPRKRIKTAPQVKPTQSKRKPQSKKKKTVTKRKSAF